MKLTLLKFLKINDNDFLLEFRGEAGNIVHLTISGAEHIEFKEGEEYVYER